MEFTQPVYHLIPSSARDENKRGHGFKNYLGPTSTSEELISLSLNFFPFYVNEDDANTGLHAAAARNKRAINKAHWRVLCTGL